MLIISNVMKLFISKNVQERIALMEKQVKAGLSKNSVGRNGKLTGVNLVVQRSVVHIFVLTVVKKGWILNPIEILMKEELLVAEELIQKSYNTH